MNYINLIIGAFGVLLIPIVIVFMTRWFSNKKEKSDRAKWESEQIAIFIEHLSSENTQEKKLALLALGHLKESGRFFSTLLQAIGSVVATETNPALAAQALILLGEGGKVERLGDEDRRLVEEVLYSMVIHFGRTSRAFDALVKSNTGKPDEYIESVIRESNYAIRELLYEKWHLIPTDYMKYASELADHYNAWLKKYDDLRPGGIRDQTVPYVFVGPDGHPFPKKAEEKFTNLYKDLIRETEANKRS